MDNDNDHDDDLINPDDDEETKARKRKRKRAQPDPPKPDPAAASRFSGQAFVPVDSGTIEERVQRRAVIDAFDAADRGDYQPGIDLGIFPDPDEDEGEE